MDDSEFRVESVAAPVRTQLVDTLRRAIFDFRFRPGDRLVERELCEMTGVSRTSLREALRQLESEGLVWLVPNRGPVVASVSPAQSRDIYELRALLEGFVGRRAAERASKSEVAALKAAVKHLKSVVRQHDSRALVLAKEAFYGQLISCCANSEIEAALRNLHGRVTLLRATSMAQPGRIQKSLGEIDAIVAAIAAGDPDAAELACRQHVENAGRAATTVLEDSGWVEKVASDR